MNKYINFALSVLLTLTAVNAQARFTQADTWQGNVTQPITLNKYTYVHNDPANLVDPSGNIATMSGLMAAINVRGIQSTTASGSYRLTLKKVGREFACISIQELVTDQIMQQLTGGVYVLLDTAGTPYVGMSNNFERRYWEHVADTRRDIERTFARFHMDIDRNDMRVVEQFFIDLYEEMETPTSNSRNSVAVNPASANSQRLRRLVNQLDFCD